MDKTTKEQFVQHAITKIRSNFEKFDALGEEIIKYAERHIQIADGAALIVMLESFTYAMRLQIQSVSTPQEYDALEEAMNRMKSVAALASQNMVSLPPMANA